MATMFESPPGVYPARGIVHLARRPKLRNKIGGFLAGVSAASVGGISVLAWTTYASQLRFVGQRLGTGVLGKVATGCLILGLLSCHQGGWLISLRSLPIRITLSAGEAYVPLFFAFSATLQYLQKQLFQDVLQGKLVLQSNSKWCFMLEEQDSQSFVVIDKRMIAEQGVFPVRQISGAELDTMNAYLQAQAEKRAAERRSRHTVKGFALHAARSAIVSAMTSPLSSVVPFAPVLLSFTSGDKATIPFISHYLRLRGLKSDEEQMAVAETHKLAYRQFGIAAALLSAVPVASWGFAFSNTVGAALWAADMEKRNYELFK